MTNVLVLGAIGVVAAVVYSQRPRTHAPQSGERWKLNGTIEGVDTSLGSEFYRGLVASAIPGTESFDLSPDGRFVMVVRFGPGAPTINTGESLRLDLPANVLPGATSSAIELRITRARKLSS